MNTGITTELIIVSLTVGILGFMIIQRVLPIPSAISVTVLKVVVPLLYFSYFYKEKWTFLDDIVYLNQGKDLIKKGFNPFTILFDEAGISYLMYISEGRHILYGWWNFLAQDLFGEYYYSPVFLNVLLTFVSAFFLNKILIVFSFSNNYRKLFLIYFLLHIDVLIWSSIINLKDIMIMMLTIMSFYCLAMISVKIRIKYIVILFILFFIFFWLRFYIPLIIFAAYSLWILSYWKNKKKFIFLPLFAVVLSVFFPWNTVNSDLLQVSSLFIGVVRYLISPQPWSIDEAYSFLLISSIINWSLFCFVIVGFYMIWSKYKNARNILIYFILIIIFYGMTPELQGPRHRVQISFILIWMQFHSIWNLLAFLSGKSRKIGE